MQCIFLEDYGWELKPLHEDISEEYAFMGRAQLEYRSLSKCFCLY